MPNPPFDYAYSWGSQIGDTALENSPELQSVMAAHNGSMPPIVPQPVPPPPAIDAISPIVKITNPLTSGSVPTRSRVQITANASDNVGVIKVEIYVNGILKCAGSDATLSCGLRTGRRAGRVLTIEAKAYDSAGNTGRSATVSLTTN